METGKVEYAPDYKSKSQVKRIAAQQGKCSMCGENHAEATARYKARHAVVADRERLEREVIEAAKTWRRGTDDPTMPWVVNDEALIVKIDALIDFESSQLGE